MEKATFPLSIRPPLKQPEMSFVPQRPPQNLSDWLETATRGLVPSAQTRIRAEIEAHYAEAVHAHMVQGLSEPDAQAQALADLGYAYAAARRFRQEHLTTMDATMAALNVHCQSWMGSILLIASITTSFFSFFHPTDPPDLSGVLWFLLWLFFTPNCALVVTGVLSWRKHASVTRRQIILLQSLAWLNAGAFAVINHFARPTVDPLQNMFGVFSTVVFFLIAAQVSFFCFRLRKKLGSAGEGDNAPPAPDPTAAA
jgi:hypothetical protein